MLFARPTLYALLALSLMSRDYPGKVVKSRELALRLSIHEAYLSKILSRLARKGVIQSHRGPSGGFQLLADNSSITLAEVLRACDDSETIERGCVMGFGACGENHHCCWHDQWRGFRDEALAAIETLTLSDLSARMLEERLSEENAKIARAQNFALNETT